MSALDNKEVQDYVEQAMKEINPELDLEYCKENNIIFNMGDKNSIIDVDNIILFSQESCDIAYNILHPNSA